MMVMMRFAGALRIMLVPFGVRRIPTSVPMFLSGIRAFLRFHADRAGFPMIGIREGTYPLPGENAEEHQTHDNPSHGR